MKRWNSVEQCGTYVWKCVEDVWNRRTVWNSVEQSGNVWKMCGTVWNTLCEEHPLLLSRVRLDTLTM